MPVPDCQFAGVNVLLIGRDAGGHWVVRDLEGRCGGLFVSRDEAAKYARAESLARLPERIVVTAVDSLELGPIFAPSQAA
jgi:hypothetical protein